jgi:hypothetical protein
VAIYADKVFAPAPKQAKANSVELIEGTLGVKVLPSRPGVVYKQGANKFRRAGGKRGGYCPL